MVWLNGGALAIGLFMVVGLLLLVLLQGLSTFWPGPVPEIRTATKVFLGEISRTEDFTPPGEPETRRRMLRTGNFELSGTHFDWISDPDIVSESEPEWAVVIERLEWGRFYGYPAAFLLDGQAIATTPEVVWQRYLERHDECRDRLAVRQELERVDIGRVNHRQERARLDVNRVVLDHGRDSPEHVAALERLARVTEECKVDFDEISGRIAELNRENDRYRMVLRTADGKEKALALSEIVRAHAPNRMTILGKAGLYLSRWWEFLSDEPREANSEGGVFPAIFGTVVMTLIMCILVVPFGVLAALYLREYAKAGFLVSTVRIAINNLAGVPSIVFGVFGLGFFCYILGAGIDEIFFPEFLPNPKYGKGGLLWASLTLALLTLPVVIVATEEALAAVPRSMREGSYACGASKWQTIRRIVLPRAMPGIMTGTILAMARGAGEVAPLMLVGAVKLAPELPIDGVAPFVHPERSFMHLGFHIYDLGFQSQNSEAAKPMVFTTTLLLIGIVVALNVASIWIRGRLRRKFGEGHF
ncbi:MAG: phosphate ABC transporter permease PstA [Planctomycetes bacterium]|nr:phosphate ABC transporter permease PstA [Planctomycetota bacterium]